MNDATEETNQVIISNQVICNNCGDAPFSSHVHDFKWCGCGAIAVDGGRDYLKRLGNLTGYKDISISIDQALMDKLSAAADWCEETNRNSLGYVFAILRELRNYELSKQGIEVS